MPRGGARPGAGRPPDPGSLTEAIRLESGAIRTLPRERTEPAPTWPLSRATQRELVVWREQWRKPQAIVWAEQNSEYQVAMYVRTLVEAEKRGATSAIRNLLVRQEISLMLTQASLLSAGFRISTNSTPQPTIAASTPAVAKRSVPSARGRLRAVEDVEPDR